jgi:membrane protease YdiL (CAAX protease family)
MPTGVSQFLATLLLCLVATASLWLWLWAVGRWRSGRRLLDYAPRRTSPWGMVDVLATVVLLVLLQSVAVRFVPHREAPLTEWKLETLAPDERVWFLLALSIAELLAVVVSLVAVRLRTGADWRDLGLAGGRVAADVRLGIIAFLMLAPVIYAIQMTLVHWFPSQHPLVVLVKQNPEPRFILLSGLTAVLVAPLAEEYFFRVLLQGWMERIATGGQDGSGILIGGRAEPVGAVPGATPQAGDAIAGHEPVRPADGNPAASPAVVPGVGLPPDASQAGPFPTAWGTAWPVLASAAFFAALHAQHGPDPIPLFALAVGLGYIYQRTHRILPCVVVHVLLNACSLLMLLIEISR